MYAMDNSSFMKWVDEQADKRGWTRSKLASKAGLSASAIYLISSGDRGIGLEVCKGLSKALELPLDVVYRVAGHLPKIAEIEEDVQMGAHYLSMMTPEERAMVLGMIESVATKRIGERGHAIQTAPHEEERS